MTNLDVPAVLDRLLTLYAPVAYTLMSEFPEAHGAELFMDGSKGPGAYPKADVPPGYVSGYSDDKFEARASELMKSVDSDLDEVIAGFPLFTGRDKFGLHVSKGNAGPFQYRIRATLRTPVLYCHFYRDVGFTPGKEVFFGDQPAIMVVMADGKDPDKAALLEQAKTTGIRDALNVIADNGMMLDFPKNGDDFKAKTLPFLDAFPTIGTVIDGKIEHIFELYALASPARGLLLVKESEPLIEDLKDNPLVEIKHFEPLLDETSPAASI